MVLTDKERVTTFLIGIFIGCLVVAGLLQRRNHRQSQHEQIYNAPVPEWAEALPKDVPDILHRGKILQFEKKEGPITRSWILEYERNYPFVLIQEDSSSTPPHYQYIAADSIHTTPKSGTTYKDYREQLKELKLFPREHFKKQNVIIVGIHQEKPTIEGLQTALKNLQSHPLVESAKLDIIEIREPEESRFQHPGQFRTRITEPDPSEVTPGT
jgi:hypothetical protein